MAALYYSAVSPVGVDVDLIVSAPEFFYLGFMLLLPIQKRKVLKYWSTFSIMN